MARGVSALVVAVLCGAMTSTLGADEAADRAASSDDVVPSTTPPESVGTEPPRRPRLGAVLNPDAVENQLEADRTPRPNFLDVNVLAPYEAFKESVYERIGLRFGGDYSVQLYGATASLDERIAASGILRFYGSWDLIGRGAENTGALVYKVEHRHAYADVAPSAFGGDLGYVGLINPPFSDQGWRLTNLYWRQRLFERRLSIVAGFLDVTDFVDPYALASPWTGFANLVFSTGSASIPLPDDATFGIAAGGFITDQIYAIGSLTDANADSSDPFRGVETFFRDFETFKTVEVGWTSGADELVLNNVHVTLWQVDARESAKTPSGWGANVSATVWLDEQWLPFLRAGYARDGGSLLEWSINAGIGYQAERGGDVFGVGVGWGRPNADTFGARLDDQITSEIFYRWQVTENIQLTPSVQILGNPALNPEEDVIAAFGLRARLAF